MLTVGVVKLISLVLPKSASRINVSSLKLHGSLSHDVLIESYGFLSVPTDVFSDQKGNNCSHVTYHGEHVHLTFFAPKKIDGDHEKDRRTHERGYCPILPNTILEL
jgi:hypothetical protein